MKRLQKQGKIKTYKSNEIQSSKFGIGLEKLDRNLFDPSKTYDYIQNLGMKYVRLQSGWARTEKVKGVYDFAWLDEIVENLLARSIEPWLCLCYGNGLYSPEANKQFGAVGVPPIFTQAERDAWDNYCVAVAKHFKGRIKMYEVWNEPDGVWCWKHGVNGREYGEFVVRTSNAIKSVDGDAKILGGSLAERYHLKWIKDALDAGMGGAIDIFTYHNYSPDHTHIPTTVKTLRCILNEYSKDIKLAQGESGAPSEINGSGAMCSGLWTEDKQAKLLLRRHLYDLQSDVEFISHFTTVDMVEALNGVVSDKASYLDYGYFGVLSAQFDENGFSVGTYAPKKSYYALQTLASLLFNAKTCDLPIMGYPCEYNNKTFGGAVKFNDLVTCSFKKENGATAFCYYKPTDVMTEAFDGVTCFMTATSVEQIRLIDLMDGTVYKLNADMIVEEGNGVYKLMFLPVRDYPLMLTFGDFFKVKDNE